MAVEFTHTAEEMQAFLKEHSGHALRFEVLDTDALLICNDDGGNFNVIRTTI